MKMAKSPKTIPFDIENVIARRARMGLVALATDHVIEHELFRLVHPIEGTQIYTCLLYTSDAADE